MIKVSLDRQTKIESGCVPRLECAHSPCVCGLFWVFFTMQYNCVPIQHGHFSVCKFSVFCKCQHKHAPASVFLYERACVSVRATAS